VKKHNRELEIDEDIALERKNWILQRIAWVLMALLVLAALLGFTGDGGLTGISKRTAGSKADGLEIDYERFLRYKAPTELLVTFYAAAGPSRHELHFSKGFYEKIQVEQVIPEPLEVYTHEQGITYRFSDNVSSVTFYLKPKRIGSITHTVSAGGPGISFSQFVYP
jgi:hypothetical protein